MERSSKEFQHWKVKREQEIMTLRREVEHLLHRICLISSNVMCLVHTLVNAFKRLVQLS